MKAFNVFFILLFIVSAGLQYNDPDPLIWMAIYLYGAYLCFLAIRNKYSPWMYIAGLSVYGLYALYLLLDSNGVISWISEHESESLVQSMKATKPWIEESREFFGLLILITVLSINMIWLSRKRKAMFREVHEAIEKKIAG
jgi:hypothetical protein